MNKLLLIGTSVVNIALIFYSISIITEQRRHIITKNVLNFLTLGVIFDITATAFMIAGSSKGPFTLHGIIGYSSLLAMFIDAVLIWKLKQKNGINSTVPNSVHLYSRIAYIWWILAYISGALIVAMRHIK
jgi:hypothetical protein